MNKIRLIQKKTKCTLLGLFFVVLNVQAQTYDEGRAAYIQGNYESAYEILLPLANAGDADAQKMLGIMFDYGQGVMTDPRTALDWYIRSAEQGQTAVQYQVGAKYFKGESIPQDYAEAAKWWGMAAEGGQVDAKFNLGLMYFRGLGVTQDDVLSAQLFEQAAQQEHGHAQYSLGVMYAFGRGVDRDYGIAREWFMRSAEKGIAQAEYNLGIFYENGNGVDVDTDQARDWYQLAADHGLKEATVKLASLNASDVGEPMHNIIATNTNENVELQKRSSPDSGYDYSEIATNGIKREKWIIEQSTDKYTIQIGSVVNEDDLRNYLKRLNIEDNSAYIQVVINGMTRYNAFYGIYGSYQEAEQAVSNLPGEIQRASPWIRNIGILQKIIN